MCVYCTDVGPHIWACIGIGNPCDITICVAMAENEQGCVDATTNPMTGTALVTKETFVCPSCYRQKNAAIPVSTIFFRVIMSLISGQYIVRGYAIRSKFLKRSPHPMLGIFLTWHGYGRRFVADTISSLLEQQFRSELHKVPLNYQTA